MHRRARLAPSFAAGLAVLAFTSAVGADDADDARIEANETSAVAALEAIRAAQERFKAARYVDVDNDAIGEYGLLRELTGVRPPRWASDGSYCSSFGCPDPDVRILDASFTNAVRGDPATFPYPTGEVVRAGYVFQLVLPGAAGVGVPETWNGTLSFSLDSDLCETTWCCYAWPLVYGDTGLRTFLINETGVIVATEDSRYSGSKNREAFQWLGAAFEPGDCPKCASITDAVAIDRTGRDGNFWSLVTPRTQERTIRARGRLRTELRFPGRPPTGSYALRMRTRCAGTDDIAIVRVQGLAPSHTYEVVVTNFAAQESASLGRLHTDDFGRGELRFDSRRDRPAGGAALTDFSSGYLSVESGSHGWAVLSAALPEFGEGEPDVPRDERIRDDEETTVAALRAIAAAQADFKARKESDLDRDGVGEYALLRELMGVAGVRIDLGAESHDGVPRTGYLPADFGRSGWSDVSRTGYRFRMMLPGHNGIGLVNTSFGALSDAIDVDLAETVWVCYAWPQRYGATGRRAFLVDASGTIESTESPAYSGRLAFTPANAAAGFLPSSSPSPYAITGTLAADAVASDGNIWRTVPDRPDDHVVGARGALGSPTGGAASGSFAIESRLLRSATDESFVADATDLRPSARHRLVPASEGGVLRVEAGVTTSDDRGRAAFTFDSRAALTPGGVATLAAFAGGTIEVVDDTDTVVLRGAIPHLATLTGPNEPGASLAYRADVVLAPGPCLRLKRGLLEVRATADSTGTREEMTLTVTTFDRLADRADVVAVAGDVETPLGTIRLSGDRGAGTLQLDTSRGDAVPGGSLRTLAGARIEVRDRTGAVLLTGTFPKLL